MGDPALKNYWRFLRALGAKPISTGAIAPSSRALAEALLGGLPLSNSRSVLEVGPGTGAITEVLLEKVSDASAIVAMELSEDMISALSARFPHLKIINDSVENILSHVQPGSVDCIVCSLPWAFLSSDLQRKILQAMHTALRPAGTVTTYSYLHGAWFPSNRAWLKIFSEVFSGVRREKVVWKNLPPAQVFRATKAESSHIA